ncbi:hypothetical protein JB92DRAFT_2831636 [Gautieria morchelliformis]|nr:hypothetical protein JB92DRAFT_2831636 [Gautieria morchelliformis]
MYQCIVIVRHTHVITARVPNYWRKRTALPTEPLNTVALADADPASSLAFINKKVQEASVEYNISPEETQLIERLDGRASDLETALDVNGHGSNVFYNDYVKAIPQKPLPDPKKFARKEGEPDRKAERRKKIEVEGQWYAVTCVALYMLLMGFSQKGIDALKRYQADFEMRFPGEDVGASDGFDDALIWFKNNFIKCNDRAALVKTWLPVEFEAEDSAWIDQLVHDRALQLSRTAARKELLDQDSSPDECEQLYEESLTFMLFMRNMRNVLKVICELVSENHFALTTAMKAKVGAKGGAKFLMCSMWSRRSFIIATDIGKLFQVDSTDKEVQIYGTIIPVALLLPVVRLPPFGTSLPVVEVRAIDHLRKDGASAPPGSKLNNKEMLTML